MAILDAMGCGLPIVSTDVGGIPKIVRQGIMDICINQVIVKAWLVQLLSILQMMKRD